MLAVSFNLHTRALLSVLVCTETMKASVYFKLNTRRKVEQCPKLQILSLFIFLMMEFKEIWLIVPGEEQYECF